MNEELTFGGEPVILEWVDGEVLIKCKNVIGTLTQVEGFINEKGYVRHYFGECKIRKWTDHKIKIDCLEDTKENFKKLYEQAEAYKTINEDE